MKENKFIRQTGPFKSKYGIRLDSIEPHQKKILLENELIKDDLISDDQFVSILFKIAEMEQSQKNTRKLFLNPYNNKITTYEKVIEQSKIIDWSCAICKKSISSEIANFSIDNFTCKKCKNVHNSTNKSIDPRIVDSSFEFHSVCRKKLIKEQKKFLKYIKYFEKGYKRGRL